MKLLLDTHIWIWSISEPERLAKRVALALSNPDNELWLSPVNSWEVVLLVEKKRAQMIPDAERWIRENTRTPPFNEAVLTHEVALQAAAVPLPHRDPADRLLVATAMVYGLTLVTADERLLRCKNLPLLANR